MRIYTKPIYEQVKECPVCHSYFKTVAINYKDCGGCRYKRKRYTQLVRKIPFGLTLKEREQYENLKRDPAIS